MSMKMRLLKRPGRSVPSASSVTGVQWNANTILWPSGFSKSSITFESIDLLSNLIEPNSTVSFFSRSLLFDIKDIVYVLQRMYTSGPVRTLSPASHFHLFCGLTIFDPVLFVPRKSYTFENPIKIDVFRISSEVTLFFRLPPHILTQDEVAKMC